MRTPLCILSALCLLASGFPAHASNDEVSLNLTELAQLEIKATLADPREQCFLYTQLVQGYTDIAGKQMADGEMEKASATLKRVQGFTEHIHLALSKDTRRLKNAEMAMHTASHHLGQYLHLVSDEDKAVAESTLKQLDKVNGEILAQVFAH